MTFLTDSNQYTSHIKEHVNTQPWGTAIVHPLYPHSIPPDVNDPSHSISGGRGETSVKLCNINSWSVTILYPSLQKSVSACWGTCWGYVHIMNITKSLQLVLIDESHFSPAEIGSWNLFSFITSCFFSISCQVLMALSLVFLCMYV